MELADRVPAEEVSGVSGVLLALRLEDGTEAEEAVRLVVVEVPVDVATSPVRTEAARSLARDLVTRMAGVVANGVRIGRRVEREVLVISLEGPGCADAPSDMGSSIGAGIRGTGGCPRLWSFFL